jgi:hypothetical protein
VFTGVAFLSDQVNGAHACSKNVRRERSISDG